MMTCVCGCGGVPKLRYGKPNRYLIGHNNTNVTRPLDERFWEKVNKDGPIPAHRPDLGPCWVGPMRRLNMDMVVLDSAGIR